MDTLYHWQLVRLLLMLVVALQLVKHRNHFVKRKLEYFDKINSSYDVLKIFQMIQGYILYIIVNWCYFEGSHSRLT